MHDAPEHVLAIEEFERAEVAAFVAEINQLKTATQPEVFPKLVARKFVGMGDRILREFAKVAAEQGWLPDRIAAVIAEKRQAVMASADRVREFIVGAAAAAAIVALDDIQARLERDLGRALSADAVSELNERRRLLRKMVPTDVASQISNLCEFPQREIAP